MIDDGGFLSFFVIIFALFSFFFSSFFFVVSIFHFFACFLLGPLCCFSLLVAFSLPFAADFFPLDWSRLVPGTPLACVCVSYCWSSASVSYSTCPSASVSLL